MHTYFFWAVCVVLKGFSHIISIVSFYKENSVWPHCKYFYPEQFVITLFDLSPMGFFLQLKLSICVLPYNILRKEMKSSREIAQMSKNGKQNSYDILIIGKMNNLVRTKLEYLLVFFLILMHIFSSFSLLREIVKTGHLW